jgi:hypothetical protein
MGIWIMIGTVVGSGVLLFIFWLKGWAYSKLSELSPHETEEIIQANTLWKLSERWHL